MRYLKRSAMSDGRKVKDYLLAIRSKRGSLCFCPLVELSVTRYSQLYPTATPAAGSMNLVA